jgi:hypothetical protein
MSGKAVKRVMGVDIGTWAGLFLVYRMIFFCKGCKILEKPLYKGISMNVSCGEPALD